MKLFQIILIPTVFGAIDLNKPLVRPNGLNTLNLKIAGGRTPADYVFKQFKAATNRRYSKEEEAKRRSDFYENLNKLKNNTDESTGLTSLADISPEEFKEKILVKNMAKRKRASHLAKAYANQIKKAQYSKYFDVKSRLKNLDWSTIWQSEVKEQLYCGSCYAFAAVGTFEGVLFLKYDRYYNFSEQFVLNCSPYSTYNLGCEGGFIDDTLTFLSSVHNLIPRDTLPYHSGYSGRDYKGYYCSITGPRLVHPMEVRPIRAILPSEYHLMHALSYGPVTAAIDSTNMQFYIGGIFRGGCTTDVNHAIIVVGWGEEENTGEKYWIIKNSWGKNWGEGGYIRIPRKYPHCGLFESAFRPVLL